MKPSACFKPRALLSEQQVIEIFLLSAAKSSDKRRRSASSIARTFGVNEKTIRDIWSGRTWHEETLPLDPTRPPKTMAKTGRPLGRKDSVPRKIRKGTTHTKQRQEPAAPTDSRNMPLLPEAILHDTSDQVASSSSCINPASLGQEDKSQVSKSGDIFTGIGNIASIPNPAVATKSPDIPSLRTISSEYRHLGSFQHLSLLNLPSETQILQLSQTYVPQLQIPQRPQINHQPQIMTPSTTWFLQQQQALAELRQFDLPSLTLTPSLEISAAASLAAFPPPLPMAWTSQGRALPALQQAALASLRAARAHLPASLPVSCSALSPFPPAPAWPARLPVLPPIPADNPDGRRGPAPWLCSNPARPPPGLRRAVPL